MIGNSILEDMEGRMFNRFEITVIVKCDNKEYSRTRRYKHGENNGCNHIDNIASTAAYMGQEMTEEIKKEVK